MTDKFKTAEELGIEEWERNRLIQLITLLPTVPHDTEEYNRVGFNLDITARTYDCGTVACIGGWCSLLEQGFNPGDVATAEQTDMADDYVISREIGPLANLFFPNHEDDDNYIEYSQITPEQAVQGITNFLTTGAPNWLSFVTQE